MAKSDTAEKTASKSKGKAKGEKDGKRKREAGVRNFNDKIKLILQKNRFCIF